MSMMAKLLAQRQRLLEQIENDTGTNEREEVECCS